MSASQIFLVAVSGLGVIHGLFLSVFLWGYPKGSQQANRLLALLLIVLSFRVGKSVFLEFTPDLDVKLIFIGLGTLMMIGPLFYLFSKTCIDKGFILRPGHLVHFVPALLGISFGFWIEESHQETLPILLFFFLFVGYYMHYLVYLLVSYAGVRKARQAGLKDDAFKLLRLLFYGLLVVWVAYVLNLLDELVPYVCGPVLYSAVAYVLSFIVIHKGYIQKIDYTKYKTTQVSDEQVDLLFSRVKKLVVDETQFANPDITLKSLSEMLNVSTQVLSMVINQKSGKNFNSYLNHYRVEEAIMHFNNTQRKNHTIASIAFEVGFNSLSSFNTAFKKETGKTPQVYRQQLTK